VAFLGKGGGELASIVDDVLIVPSASTSHVQLIHMAIQHLIVELVEREHLAQ
jgi:phosphoheptose isomerase